jgi:hypothetical protein
MQSVIEKRVKDVPGVPCTTQEGQSMVTRRIIRSGGKRYNDKESSDGTNTLRENDGFFHDTGTKVAETDSLEDSLAAAKEHSGGKDVSSRKL